MFSEQVICLFVCFLFTAPWWKHIRNLIVQERGQSPVIFLRCTESWEVKVSKKGALRGGHLLRSDKH